MDEFFSLFLHAMGHSEVWFVLADLLEKVSYAQQTHLPHDLLYLIAAGSEAVAGTIRHLIASLCPFPCLIFPFSHYHCPGMTPSKARLHLNSC